MNTTPQETASATPSWNELAPIAHAATRSQRRALLLTALATLLIGALLIAGWSTGLLSPRLSSNAGSGSMELTHKTFEVTIEVRNAGLRTERLSTSTPRWPGIDIRTAGVSPREVAPGATGTLTLTGTVTDCAAFTAAGLGEAMPDGPHVTVSAERLWGRATVTLRADIARSVIDEICSPTTNQDTDPTTD